MKVGIDKLGFYAPKTYLDLETLAQARNVDSHKYTIGIGQKKMALPSYSEDVITMALEAADSILDDLDKQSIDTVLFATETAVDFSKAAGIYMHSLLGLKPSVRILEVKQACYASTGALFMACDHVKVHPSARVLILASDVAWYGFETAGEATQGAGAIAMVVSAQPRIAEVFEGQVITENRSDFYRPSYSSIPVVDGKLSIESYKTLLKKVEMKVSFPYICFHMPFAKMANKANEILEFPMSDENLNIIKDYGSEIGNIYNGSLYLSLLSLIMKANEDLSQQTIGMFSYGSGAIGEFFTITFSNDYNKAIHRKHIDSMFENRISLSIKQYHHMMEFYQEREASSDFLLEDKYVYDHQKFVLHAISKGHREYKRI